MTPIRDIRDAHSTYNGYQDDAMHRPDISLLQRLNFFEIAFDGLIATI